MIFRGAIYLVNRGANSLSFSIQVTSMQSISMITVMTTFQRVCNVSLTKMEKLDSGIVSERLSFRRDMPLHFLSRRGMQKLLMPDIVRLWISTANIISG